MKKEDIEEVEKNMNYVIDKSYNRFKFDVRENLSYAKAIIDFRYHLRRKEYVQACELADEFFHKYQMAMREAEPITNLMKAHWNTLKAHLKKNVV